MNLSKKKELAKRVLGLGKKKVIFIESRLGDIKEAITKQDIRDLQKEGAIIIREKKGKRIIRKKKGRSTGNIRKKVKTRKQDYVVLTRKLRKYVSEMRKKEKISGEITKDIRKKIRNKAFRSRSHLKEYIGGLKK